MGSIVPNGARVEWWRVMRALHHQYGWFTSRTLIDICGVGHRKTIEHYLAFLTAEQVVTRTEPSRPAEAAIYRLDRPDGEAPPLVPRAPVQTALWNAMRAMRTFGYADLAEMAATDERPISSDTARSYCRDLSRAGYIRELGHHRTCGTPTPVWHLPPSRNTGPRAPIILRGQTSVYDLNLMRIVNVTAPMRRVA